MIVRSLPLPSRRSLVPFLLMATVGLLGIGKASPVQAAIYSKLTASQFGNGADLSSRTRDGGFVFADLNNDGLLDLVLLNDYLPSSPPRVLRNRGLNSSTGNYDFVEEVNALPDQDGSFDGVWPSGTIVAGDYDNDGDIDLFAVDRQLNEGRWLWQNNLVDNDLGEPVVTGSFEFSLLTYTPFPEVSLGTGATKGVALGDFDGDGDLDVLLDSLTGTKELYDNKLEQGVIQFVKDATAVTDNVTIGRDLSVVDVNLDGYLDFVSRSSQANNSDILFFNNGNGIFTDVVAATQASFTQASQGATAVASDSDGLSTVWGDYDNNGTWDLVVQNTGTGYTTRFYIDGWNSSPTATIKFAFVDKNFSSDIGVSIPTYSSPHSDYGGGVIFGDVNNDGKLDLFMGSPRYDQGDELYLNQGKSLSATYWQFSRISDTETALATGSKGEAEAAALADWDNDGDLDLYVHNDDTEDVIFRNDTVTSTAKNYLRVRVTCAQRTTKYLARDCIGAVVQVFKAGDLDGDKIPDVFRPGYPGAPVVGSTDFGKLTNAVVQTSTDNSLIGMRTVSGGMGLGAQDPFVLHFGVPNPSSYYTVRVLFPGGKVILKDIQPSATSGKYFSQTLAQYVEINDKQTSDDGDGIPTTVETTLGTSGTDLDSDDDGLMDWDEWALGTTGSTSPAKPDTDGDGIWDGVEKGEKSGIPDMDSTGPLLSTDTSKFKADADSGITKTNPLSTDTDGDGLVDGYLTGKQVLCGGEDLNGDGAYDSSPTSQETNPLDLDTDDDGVTDGSECSGYTPTSGAGPYKGDPRIDDSDGDGILDGTEMGIQAPEKTPPTTNPYGVVGTQTNDPSYRPDTCDKGAKTTNPKVKDTDGDKLDDGSEDYDKDGCWEWDSSTKTGETDPTQYSSDGSCSSGESGDGDGDELNNKTNPLNVEDDTCSDPDKDGLDNAEEKVQKTDPNDADTDNDGLSDGLEVSLSLNPLNADTDGDGLPDGSYQGGCGEDRNNDGVVNAGETDPLRADSDFDGLKDGIEDKDKDCAYEAAADETNPLDADSDDDGIPDGTEDYNKNGVFEPTNLSYPETHPAHADSDGDGLPDGLELGLVKPILDYGTDPARFSADQDPSTKTDPNKVDSDGDGLGDGTEDKNSNGRWDLDSGLADYTKKETDPTKADTDGDGCSDGYELTKSPSSDPTTIDTDADGLDDCEEHGLGTNPLKSDTDGDQLSDYDEIHLYNSDPLVVDTDKDNLADAAEVAAGTDPRNKDTDGDTLLDGDEINHVLEPTSPLSSDTDEDGEPDNIEVLSSCPLVATDPDTDGDGILDGVEDVVKNCTYNPANRETDAFDADTDDDGLLDGEEDASADGENQVGETDPRDPDTDGDGVQDGTELGLSSPHQSLEASHATDTDLEKFVADQDPVTTTSPLKPDTDGDTLADGQEDKNANGRWEPQPSSRTAPGETDPNARDSDMDELDDNKELEAGTDPNDRDTDDGCESDGSELKGKRDPVDNPEDDNCADRDGDLIPNALEEEFFHSNPDDADTDDDGVLDGYEPGLVDSDGDGKVDAWKDVDGDGETPSSEAADVDGDGLTSLLDPDSDNDGILDGTETGIYTLVTWLNPDGSAVTREERGRYKPDADAGRTVTDPNLADTDSGGVDDGAEDSNHNGTVDLQAKELDPTSPEDDPLPIPLSGGACGPESILDSDCDGLTDAEEESINTGKAVWVDPRDADSDDDGVLDGEEDNWRVDMDEDGLIDVRDVDSDNDGVLDGTELGVTAGTRSDDTDTRRGYFRADANPATTTSMVNADTDFGGADDGAEDPDHDGLQAMGGSSDDELDPLDPADDPPRSPSDTTTNCEVGSFVLDSDCDGLTDQEEVNANVSGSGPMEVDADSDDDGLMDGDEDNWSVDTDGDGTIDAMDCDSDDDGLNDGTERGVTSKARGTASGTCFVIDADPDTKTVMIEADTDGGIVPDGTEDLNHNGKLDTGESDPNKPGDDCTDLDEDALCEEDEALAGTSDLDADSDDDGVIDSADGTRESPWNQDYDQDGLINALDPDSDNDGVLDGTEQGVTEEDLTSDTNTDLRFFVEDDDPNTETDPCNADSDGDLFDDGAEDPDHDGNVDEGEWDPNTVDPGLGSECVHKGTLVQDTDCDGLTDLEEKEFSAQGLSAQDADSDDDGVLDGEEDNWSVDMDNDGDIDALDADADGDKVLDGTERGLTSTTILVDSGSDEERKGTDLSKSKFVQDEDPSTTTYMVVANTDHDKFNDGDEDCNRNGRLDCAESDPRDETDPTPNTQSSVCLDSDKDEVTDAVETMLGTDIKEADSDADSIPDLVELGGDACATAAPDTDGDGSPNVMDDDSDNDGILDEVEVGADVSHPQDTDADGTPNYLDTDSDDDGLSDYDEVKIYGTYPYVADSDNGGVDDGTEVNEHHTGPMVPEDDNTGLRGGGCSTSGDAGQNVPSGLALLLLGALPFFRRSRRQPVPTQPSRAVPLCLLALSILLPSVALAEDTTAPPSDSRFSAQTFRPALDMGAYFTQWDAQSLTQWHFNLGLTLNYASNPLVQRDLDSSETGQKLVDRLATGDIYAGLGLTDFISVHLSVPVSWGSGMVPVMISDTVPIPSAYEGFATIGLGDAWAAAKFQVLNPRKSAIGLALVPEFSFPLGSKEYFFSEQGPTTRLRAVVESDLEFLRVSVNLAYRLRSRVQLQDILLEDAVEYGLAMQVPIVSGLDVTTELAGSLVARSFADEQFTYDASISRDGTSPLELLAGAHYVHDSGFQGFAGVGVGLTNGVGAPAWRGFLGLGYRSPLNLDEDGDGIPDRFDKCPEEPENFNGVMDEDGCPEPDTDGDSIVDPVDACPTAAEDMDGYQDEDGCPDLDNDGDGIPDAKDQCPNEAEDKDGFEDNDGCPDLDNDKDGLPDAKDRCPNQPEDFDGFEDDEGCPDNDNDQDGLVDTLDKCPNDPEDKDGFQDDDGCPDPDNDGDGVPDVKDLCPLEAEVINGVDDEDGCPDEGTQLVLEKEDRLVTLFPVHFETNKAIIRADSETLLNQLSAILRAKSYLKKIRIEGHTDSDGDDMANLELSQARASSVRDYLIKQGVEPERLEAVGYGETRPIASNKTQAGKERNRRVDFIIVEREEKMKLQKKKAPSEDLLQQPPAPEGSPTTPPAGR